MKFLVLTDLHQKLSSIEWINEIIKENNPEFVIILGDITDMGTGKEAVDIISKIKSKDIYVIPGNCDSKDFDLEISSIATSLHGKSIKKNGYHIAGLGGSNITPFKTPFELSEREIFDLLDPISDEYMILITHAPGLDTLDSISSGIHVGSPSIKKIIDKYMPILALSGHIHEDIGMKKINDTLCVNPGPAMHGHYAIIEIVDKEIDVKLLTFGLKFI